MSDPIERLRHEVSLWESDGHEIRGFSKDIIFVCDEAERLRAASQYYVDQCQMCASGVECQDSLCWAFREALQGGKGDV